MTKSTAADIDYTELSNAELIHLVELPEDLDGLRYYIPKPSKIELLTGTTAERQAEILATARARQQEHHVYLRDRRATGTKIDKGRQIEKKLSGQGWRYVEHQERADGFRDDITGRAGKIAYVIVGVTDGRRLSLLRGTVEEAHRTLGTIANWPPPRGRRPAREAAAAGMVTVASLRNRR